jgi:uncharacterized protein (TIGR02145 family)
MKKYVTILLIFLGIIPPCAGQMIKDIDGNTYLTITIGKQVWLAENLKTTKLNDGSSIANVKESEQWRTIEKPGYCWLNNDESNRSEYGALYNWFAVSSKRLCPSGWHVPTATEWDLMITSLGDPEYAGDKLKEKGDEHWKNALSTATNEYDFTALPGGMRLEYGNFPLFANNYGVWWTSTQFDAFQAWNRGLFFQSSKTFKGHESKRNGFSVRCIKD